MIPKYYDKINQQYLKAGRFNSRDNPKVFSIEPVIETICSKLGESLGIPVAEVHLEIQHINYKETIYETFIGVSRDFMPIGSEKIRLSQLYTVVDYEDLLERDDSLLLRQLLLFDYIIMNEDRHSKNFEWIITEDDIAVASLFDHGFSLLYDDIRGMLKDFKKASRYCQTGDLFYGYPNIEKLIREYCDSSMINWFTDIACVVNQVKDIYYQLYTCSLNTVYLQPEWFDKVTEFIKWRMDLLRELLDSSQSALEAEVF